MSAKQLDPSKESFDLPSSWQNAWKISASVGVVGLVAAFGLGMSDARRFSFSYLFAFYVFLTIALGSLFFVLIQRLTSAGWSVTVRRMAEFCASGLWIFAPLFAVIFFYRGSLYPWMSHGHGDEHHASDSLLERVAHAQPQTTAPVDATAAIPAAAHGTAPAASIVPSHGNVPTAAGILPSSAGGSRHGVGTGTGSGSGRGAGTGAGAGNIPGHGAAAHAATGHPANLPDPHAVAHAQILAKKEPYLNVPFFSVRAIIYFVVWALLGFTYLGYSTKEDKSKNPEWTLKAQRLAPVATILFGFTLTFAAFDWLMSLDPAWFSTIYGVYIFSMSVVSSLATIILLAMALRDAGPLKNVVTVEHFHDLGKLMFGFNVFWAYIGFSQMMLIWYAALPEETTFYHMRWDDGSWATVSMVVLLGHFVVPFLFLISRNVKRRLPLLRVGAVLMLCMHVIDMYWTVMPNYTQSALSVMDFVVGAACVVGIGGVYFAWVFFQMTKHALIPIGDPRLQRSIAFQNA